ncbi:hypothetical protein BH09SUM1_BH09SUM1_33150 [soil metagenome]
MKIGAFLFLSGILFLAFFAQGAAIQPAAEGADPLSTFIEGRLDAPYLLVIPVTLDCPICKRFLTSEYPRLRAEGIESGLLRVQFLMEGSKEWPRDPRRMAVTAKLAGAGMPARETILLMMGEKDSTTSDTLAAMDANQRAEVMASLAQTPFKRTAFLAAHRAASTRLRSKFLQAKSGTPAFFLFQQCEPGAIPDTLPVYSFYGFQKSAAILEAMEKDMNGAAGAARAGSAN